MAGKGGFDIEMMRSLFQDSRIWIVLAQVKQTNITTDRATMRVKVETLPDRDLIIAQMTWEAVGNDGGVFMLPNPGDIVLVAMENGSPDNAYVIKRLTNKEDTIPQRALTGDLVLKALAGKKAHLTSNTRINIGKGGTTEEAEPLVLGGVLLEALGTLYDRLDELLQKLIAGPVGMGNLGNPVPTYPQLITDLTALKADVAADKSSYIDTPNSNIVSQIAFTER